MADSFGPCPAQQRLFWKQARPKNRPEEKTLAADKKNVADKLAKLRLAVPSKSDVAWHTFSSVAVASEISDTVLIMSRICKIITDGMTDLLADGFPLEAPGVDILLPVLMNNFGIACDSMLVGISEQPATKVRETSDARICR